MTTYNNNNNNNNSSSSKNKNNNGDVPNKDENNSLTINLLLVTLFFAGCERLIFRFVPKARGTFGSGSAFASEK